MSHFRSDGVGLPFTPSRDGGHVQSSRSAEFTARPEPQPYSQSPPTPNANEVFNSYLRYAYSLQASGHGVNEPVPSFITPAPGNFYIDTSIPSTNNTFPLNEFIDPASLAPQVQPFPTHGATSIPPTPNPPPNPPSATLSRTRSNAKRKKAPGTLVSGGPASEPVVAPSKRPRKSRQSTSNPTQAQPSTSNNTTTAQSPPSSVIASSSTVAPAPTFASLVRSKAGHAERRDAASDVWWAVVPVTYPGATGNEHLRILSGRDGLSDEERSRAPSRTKPSPTEGSRVVCRYCREWQSWANTRSGSTTTTIREHMFEHHFKRPNGENGPWKEDIIKHQLKGYDSDLIRSVNTSCDGQKGELNGGRPVSYEEGEFTLDGFLQRLVRWIIVDDQSIAVVDTPELRDLLLYLHAGLQDNEIPKRGKLTKTIFQRFLVEYERMIDEMKNSLGRISYTSDCWSDHFYRPFMGTTAHYCAWKGTRLVVRHRLIAFRYLPGSHTGENMADVFLSILSEVGVKEKIGIITLDNASNNNTMMAALEGRLKEEGIEFDEIQNRGRCFPHVVNIAVQTMLKMISKSAPNPDPMCRDEPAEHVAPLDIGAIKEADELYVQILRNDPVAKCRTLVADCRKSSQRREDFIATIKEGNTNKQWEHDSPVNQLIRDVDTRWSSTFLMIDRALELSPAIAAFLDKDKQAQIRQSSALTDAELVVLDDIRQVLMIPHIVQQMLSMEKMPTLPNVIPAYEQLMHALQTLEGAYRFRHLKPAISAAIKKIEIYMLHARRTRVYALAMAINPLSKFEVMETTWSQGDVMQAKVWLREAMLVHRVTERRTAARESASRESISSSHNHGATNPLRNDFSRPSSQAGPSAPAHNGLAAGLAKLRQHTASAVSRPSSLPLSRTPSDAADRSAMLGMSVAAFDQQFTDIDSTQTREPSIEETELQEQQARVEDERLVDKEIERWCRSGTIPETSTERSCFDLVLWWQGKASEADFPLLFRVALDVLPMQASAVPCERVFSSSKHTSSHLRNQMSPQLMEVCQILKYLFKQQRLDSTGEWGVSDADTLDAADPPEDARETGSLISNLPAPFDTVSLSQRVDELYDSLFTNDAF